MTSVDASLRLHQKRTRALFDVNLSGESIVEASTQEERATRMKLACKFREEYASSLLEEAQVPSKSSPDAVSTGPSVVRSILEELHVEEREKRSTTTAPPSAEMAAAPGMQVSLLRPQPSTLPASKKPLSMMAKSVPAESVESALALVAQSTGTDTFVDSTGSRALIRTQIQQLPKPEWRAPWKLMRVMSGHLGWVRSVAVDPGNEWFATGSADRVIKIWDLATGTLKLTLTGHISSVRGLAISPRHPYLFSCGEDKQVKCWDLEYNKVIRHYHGHLSSVFCMALHPTLDVLITGGRDSVARVWDMRTRQQVHVLTGHRETVASICVQGVDPQVITGSMDSTVRLWDLAAGKTLTQLTHHKKSVRAMALHPREMSLVSASPDNIKQWKLPEGRFIQNLSGQRAIINATSVNQDGVLFSGGDNGSMKFWDWKSGYNFQSMDTVVQPGSLDSEAGIFCSTFDHSGTRLITGEADKTIKIWKEDEQATPETHPIQWTPKLKKDQY